VWAPLRKFEKNKTKVRAAKKSFVWKQNVPVSFPLPLPLPNFELGKSRQANSQTVLPFRLPVPLIISLCVNNCLQSLFSKETSWLEARRNFCRPFVAFSLGLFLDV